MPTKPHARRKPNETDVARVPLFNGVDPTSLTQLEGARKRFFENDDVVVHEGEFGSSLFVILKGQVGLYRLGTLIGGRGEGEVVGEQACIDTTVRSATAIAVGATELLEISCGAFSELLRDQVFAQNMLRNLSGKLRQSSEDRAYRYAREQQLFSEFRAHVSPEVLDELLSEGVEQYGNPRRIDATILFSDIRGFTEKSSRLEPEEVGEQLGQYLDAMVEIVHKHGGLVDKFVGDAVMAVWGIRPSGEDFAQSAFDCAAEMIEVATGGTFAGEPIQIGVGLHAGDVFVGNVGSDGKRQFTILGTPVNIAARLESASKELGAPIVVSDTVYARLPTEMQDTLTRHDDVQLKGIGSATCFTYTPAEQTRKAA